VPRSRDLLGATLELERTTVRPGERVGCVLINTGELSVAYGAGDWLELLVDGAWLPSDTPQTPKASPAWERTLTPGARSRLDVFIPDDVPAGHYRLCKSLTFFTHGHPDRPATATVEPLTVHAEFEIVTGS
jgi:hypothetical protein